MNIEQACEAFKKLITEQQERVAKINCEKTDFAAKKVVTIGVVDGDGIGPIITHQAARVLDKLELARDRGVPSHTPFLSPGEQAAVTDLLNAWGHPRHLFFGGYEGAERRVCAFLPDWQEQEDWLCDPEGAVCALRAAFPKDADPNHRDVLGALMGLGITREKIGDLLVFDGHCDALVLTETAPILQSQLSQVGRYPVSVAPIGLDELEVKPPEVKLIRDTVATLRLDAVASSGFAMARGKAAALIESGRVSLNHREVLKPDRSVAEGDTVSCKGLGKFVIKEASGLSKKGRIMIVLERYI